MASMAVRMSWRVQGPLSPPLAPGTGGVAGGGGWANQAAQQKLNAQLTSTWWRRIATSERTWKSAQPSSSLEVVTHYGASTGFRPRSSLRIRGIRWLAGGYQ